MAHARLASLPTPANSRRGSARETALATSPKAADTWADFFTQRLWDRWRTFRRVFKSCRRDCTPVSVHEVRTSLRRLLSTLDLLLSMVPNQETSEARQQLKRLFDRFSELRDVQSQIHWLERVRERQPQVDCFIRWLNKTERKLRRQTQKHTRRLTNPRLKKRFEPTWRNVDHQLRLSANDRAIERKLTRSLQLVHARLTFDLGKVELEDTDSIHRLRISLKKYRYTVECLQPALANLKPRDLRVMQGFQYRLGQIQDRCVLLDYLETFLEIQSPKNRRLIESFHQANHRAIQAMIRRFVPVAVHVAGFPLPQLQLLPSL